MKKSHDLLYNKAISYSLKIVFIVMRDYNLLYVVFFFEPPILDKR